jgi:hypothetical protein
MAKPPYKKLLFCRLAKKILSPKKDFLKICGSNLKLKELTLLVAYKKPYDTIAKSQGRFNWRCSCDEIRIFYRQNPLLNFNLSAPGDADLDAGA